MTKLSIIIPCYNCEKTLKEALDSCFQQGFDESEFEIIMVDDHSTDGTRNLIEKLSKDKLNISSYFHDKNMGGGAARNTAVKNSKGDVIFCLDSDDILPQNTLSKMYNFMIDKKCDGVTIHRSIKFSGDDKNAVHNIDESNYAGKKIPFTALFSNKEEFCPMYVTFMYTRKAFDRIGGYPTSHGYDTQGFGWRFMCAGLSLYTCPEAEYLHRIHASESYFMREYNSGKMNYNWRDILLEHYYIFNTKTLDFIRSFDCKDFTKNIMDELLSLDNILISGFENELGKEHAPLNLSGTEKNRLYVKRNSLLGVYFRLKTKLMKIFRKISLALGLSKGTKDFIRRLMRPSFLYFLRKNTNPISDYYGLDRGQPIDRYYIDSFIKENKEHIKGVCLEVLDDKYSSTYGEGRISKLDVLDIEKSKNATVIGDLRHLENVSSNSYDCLIMTQVFQFIDDVESAISECHRILKPGGVLLATLPSISRIDCVSGTEGDYWRFTTASTKYLFNKYFNGNKTLEIESKGNARVGIYFYAGLSQEDVSKKVFEKNDTDFPLIITVKAIK